MNIVYIGSTFLFLLLVVGKLYGRRGAGNRIVHILQNNCARCRSCIKKCRHHVLGMVSDADGTSIVVKKPDRCTGCGDCIGACNFNALELVERNDRKSKEYELF